VHIRAKKAFVTAGLLAVASAAAVSAASAATPPTPGSSAVVTAVERAVSDTLPGADHTKAEARCIILDPDDLDPDDGSAAATTPLIST